MSDNSIRNPEEHDSITNNPTPTELFLSQFFSFPGGVDEDDLGNDDSRRKHHPVYWKENEPEIPRFGRSYHQDLQKVYVPGHTYIIDNLLKKLMGHKDTGNTSLSAMDCARYFNDVKKSIDKMISDSENTQEYYSPLIMLFRTRFHYMFENKDFVEDLFGSLFSEWFEDENTPKTIRPILGIDPIEMKKFINLISENSIDYGFDEMLINLVQEEEAEDYQIEKFEEIVKRRKEATEFSLNLTRIPLLSAGK
jgi:hypothetical protein